MGYLGQDMCGGNLKALRGSEIIAMRQEAVKNAWQPNQGVSVCKLRKGLGAPTKHCTERNCDRTDVQLEEVTPYVSSSCVSIAIPSRPVRFIGKSCVSVGKPNLVETITTISSSHRETHTVLTASSDSGSRNEGLVPLLRLG